MKKIILLYSCICFSVLSVAQVNLQTVIKPGTKLVYGVESGEQRYNFIVTVKTLQPAVVFDWEMTNDNNSKGTITHTPNAMMLANTLYNYFAPGATTLDDNTLSVWLSKSTFSGLTKGKKRVWLKMNTGEQPREMGVTAEDPAELKILLNGEKETVEEIMANDLSAPNAPQEDRVYFTFSKYPNMPVIIRMKNGFYIALKEIKTR